MYQARLAGMGFFLKGFLGFLNKTQSFPFMTKGFFTFWVFHICKAQTLATEIKKQ